MKISKIYLMILSIIIFISTNVQIVYADSASVNLKSDKSVYMQGQIVSISILLEDIDSDNGISSLSGIFGYDNSIFEIVDGENGIISLNGWEKAEYNKSKNEFSVKSSETKKTSQAVLKISLKIKDEAKVGDTFIMLKELKVGNGDNNISTAPATLSLSIKENNTSIPNIITINPSPINISTVSSPKATASASPITITSTPSSKNENLPQTGIDDLNEKNLLIGALMISIGTFILYRRNGK